MSISLSSRRLQTDPSLARDYREYETGRQLSNEDDAQREADRLETLRLCEQILRERFAEDGATQARYLSVLHLRFKDGALLSELAGRLGVSPSEAREIEQELLTLLREELAHREVTP